MNVLTRSGFPYLYFGILNIIIILSVTISMYWTDVDAQAQTAMDEMSETDTSELIEPLEWEETEMTQMNADSTSKNTR